MIATIYSETINLNPANCIDALSNILGDRDGFAVLESGGLPSINSTHDNSSFIMLEPVLRAECSAGASAVYGRNGLLAKYSDPWAALGVLIAQTGGIADRIPLISGFIGYEALHLLENVPGSGASKIPDYVFYLYRKVISQTQNGTCSVHKFSFSEALDPFWESNLSLGDLSLEVDKNYQAKCPCLPKTKMDLTHIIETHSNFSRSKYIEAVASIIESILDGDYYQVNLSQQITLPWDKKPSDYFHNLRRVSPAAYSAYINIGKSHTLCPFSIVSSSPELFFRTFSDEIICSPIKGTRPRGSCPTEDAALCDELAKSSKDRAELAMIVDLVRNDLGRIAKAGTVEVLDHARIESLPQVHHLVSDVKCVPAKGTEPIDIIKALFPCGSVTGAPKIAAMKAISNYEKCPRGVYTGAIGCINADGTTKFNVAIRTATISKKELVFNVGGGIVVGSRPEAEYEETLAKARGLLEAWAF